MTSPFVYISAWNDSGGGFLHRLFDGHRQIRCYPFEVQLGTGISTDGLTDWFHPKYRWPSFPVGATSDAIFSAIINDELWDAVGGAPSAKFKAFSLDLDVQEWRRRFADRLEKPLPVGAIVRSYLDTFFEAWRDRQGHDEETLTLGHCPVLVIDWDRIRCDDPSAKMINVVRSPFTGFVDMRRRHPALDPNLYGRKWSLVSTLAFVAAAKNPDRFQLTAFSDLVRDRTGTMRRLANWLDIEDDSSLSIPSWNGRPLQELGPFGGVPRIGIEHETDNLTQLEPQTIEILAGSTAAARALFNIPVPQ